MNILILCTGNSARSILLESIINTIGAKGIKAFSAGSNPTGAVHPQSLRLLKSLGHDVTTTRSKSWDAFSGPDAPWLDIVITVCDNAAAETCPVWFGTPVQAHWGVPDPAAADLDDWEEAFRAAFETLYRRARAMLDLPLQQLDDKSLQTELDRIGNIE